MNENLVASIEGRSITGRDAAIRWAESKGRNLHWNQDGTFQFVDGVQIYRLIPWVNGWHIERKPAATQGGET